MATPAPNTVMTLVASGSAPAAPPEPVPVAFLGRTSTLEMQDPRASLRRQIRSSQAWLPPGWFIAAVYWDVESGGLDLEQRSQGDAYRAFTDAGIPRDGGMADLLTEAQSPIPKFAAVICENIERSGRDTFNALKLEKKLSRNGIPLFATEVVDGRLLGGAPRFRERLRQHKGGLFRGAYVCACPDWENDRGEHLLSIVDHTMIGPILARLLDERQFLSAFGVRSVSKIHERHTDLGVLPGVGEAMIEYVPGESTSPLFGGNSNWRGPIWLPVNYLLIQSIQKFHRFLGDGFVVDVPCIGKARLTLSEVAHLIAERVASLYRRGEMGIAPAMQVQAQFGSDAHWRDLLLFYEYFHAETGQGLGACHQTGWTGLIANLLLGEYRDGVSNLIGASKNLETAAETGRVG